MNSVYDNRVAPGRSLANWGRGIRPAPPPAVAAPAEADAPPPFAARRPLASADRLVLPPAVRERFADLVALATHHELIARGYGMAEVDPAAGCMGVLVYGPHGTGKSTLVEALATALDRPVVDVDLAAVESPYPGRAAQNVQAAFRVARAADAVLFFDECSALIGRRPTGGQAADRNHHLTQSVLLKELERHAGVVAFASNYLAELEPAFSRRIGTQFEVPPPDQAGRAELWRRLVAPRAPGREALDFDALAAGSDELAGGDIKTAVWVGLVASLRRPAGDQAARTADFLAAADRVRADKRRFGGGVSHE